MIECKKSTKPFVVLCDDSETFTIGEFVLHDELRGRCMNYIAEAQSLPSRESFFNRRSMPVLGRKSRLGYALVKAHSRDDSEIYGEVLKLAKASEDALAREDALFERNYRNNTNANIAT